MNYENNRMGAEGNKICDALYSLSNACFSIIYIDFNTKKYNVLSAVLDGKEDNSYFDFECLKKEIAKRYIIESEVEDFYEKLDFHNIKEKFSNNDLKKEELFEKRADGIDGWIKIEIASDKKKSNGAYISILEIKKGFINAGIEKERYKIGIHNVYGSIAEVDMLTDTYELIYDEKGRKRKYEFFSELVKNSCDYIPDYLKENYVKMLDYDNLKQKFKTKKVFTILIDNAVVNNEIRHFEITVCNNTLKNKTDMKFLFMVKDVTDTRNKEHIMKKHEQKLVDNLKSSYRLVASVNITKNEYILEMYSGFAYDNIPRKGMYDVIISAGANLSVDDISRYELKKFFSIENLLDAYKNGEKEVCLEHMLLSKSGEYEWYMTKLIFEENTYDDDIIGIILSSSIQDRISEQQEKTDLEKGLNMLYDCVVIYEIGSNNSIVRWKNNDGEHLIEIQSKKLFKKFFKKLHENDKRKFYKYFLKEIFIKKVNERNFTKTIEECRILNDSTGEYEWFEISAILYPDSFTNKLKCTIAIRNVNDIKKIQFNQELLKKRLITALDDEYSLIYEVNYTTNDIMKYIIEDEKWTLIKLEDNLLEHYTKCYNEKIHPDYRKEYEEVFSPEAMKNYRYDNKEKTKRHVIYKRKLNDSEEYSWCSVRLSSYRNDRMEKIVMIFIQDIDEEQKKQEVQLQRMLMQDKKIQKQKLTLQLLSERSNDIYIMYNVYTKAILYISSNIDKVLGKTFSNMKIIYDLWEISSSASKVDREKMEFMLAKWNKKDVLVSNMFFYENPKTHKNMWFTFTFYPSKIANDKTFVCVISDVTLIKQHQNKLEKALEAANQANMVKTNFLRSMSHDIRTPLNAILGMSDIAIANLNINNTEQVMNSLRKIQTSSQYLFEIINEVLNMAKLDYGGVVLKYENFVVEEFLNKISDMMKFQARQKQIEFNCKGVNIKHNYLCGDVGKMTHIAMNVIGNAIKFTKSGGNVEFVFTEMQNDESKKINIKIECIDNGIGISKSFIDKIYEPFEREENSTINKIEGTGLGLAITKNYVELLNGQIAIQSEKNKGTIVEILLTFDINKEYVNIKKETTGKIDRGIFKGKRILIVEDKELNREIVKKFIEWLGADNEEAVDGLEAVKKIEESDNNYYNLILMDLMMPNMDGYKATKYIRKLNRDDTKSIPIIAMTANVFEDDIQKAMDAGMNGYISKPINKNQFEHVIAEKLI